MESSLKYVLITPARNEAEYLELTINSVVSQTIRPLKWVIVNDNSTDATAEIVRRHAAQHPWIELVNTHEQQTRNFAGKVGAFNAGHARVKDLDYDIIGSLDADISFTPDYFQFLLAKFAADPKLGLGGTPFNEGGQVYDYRFSSTDHVSGACQLFRRACFEQIGGYVPLKGGGIDVVAVLSARMKGWRTRTFPEKQCLHHRPMGSANHRQKLLMNYKLGQRAWRVGFHPLWQVFRSTYQMTRKPYILGGIALFVGYFWAMIRRVERPVSRELIVFQGRDQMRRLREFFVPRALRARNQATLANGQKI
jgi:biofilm PGA synthesis N-glycosyltransferase PgaC